MIDWFKSLNRMVAERHQRPPAPPVHSESSLLRDRLKQDLIRHEGLRLKPYQDTVGKWTIGVGRNLSDRGISEPEAMHLLANDIDATIDEVNARLPWVPRMDEERRLVIYNMAFNLGMPKLLGFANTLRAVEEGRYADASRGMLDSLWARQVGNRASELAQRMRTG